MNPLTRLFERKNKNLLSVYFTAGYPEKESTVKIIHSLQESGMISKRLPWPTISKAG